MKSSLKKVEVIVRKFLAPKVLEQKQKQKSLTKTSALTESQIWRANVEKLCKEFDESFEKRKSMTSRKLEKY